MAREGEDTYEPGEKTVPNGEIEHDCVDSPTERNIFWLRGKAWTANDHSGEGTAGKFSRRERIKTFDEQNLSGRE